MEHLPPPPASSKHPLSSDLDFYIKELDKANMKLDRCLNHLELIEALTTDRRTARRIRTFLEKEGVWPPIQYKD